MSPKIKVATQQPTLAINIGPCRETLIRRRLNIRRGVAVSKYMNMALQRWTLRTQHSTKTNSGITMLDLIYKYVYSDLLSEWVHILYIFDESNGMLCVTGHLFKCKFEIANSVKTT